jgi:hypothetical protein
MLTGTSTVSVISDEIIHYASLASADLTLTNALDITGSSTDLTCSFNGGCTLDINAKGLSTLLDGDAKNNYVTVCDRKCVFDNVLSTDSVSKCFLPEISTTYSNLNFNISEPQDDLKSGVYWSTYPNTLNAFDDVMTDSVSGGSTGECNIGMAFKPKHIGLLSSIKWFMGDIANGDTTYLQDKLIFQGSLDNTTYTDIFKVDLNVHEGWNYKTWEAKDYQKFRFYRFHGESKDLCKMNELKFTGVETIADE